MNNIFTYGVISGAVLVAFSWGGELIFRGIPETFDTQEIYGYVSMILGLCLIFFGVRRYRDDLAGGNISFGKALQIGVLTDLLASTIYGMFMLIYFRWIAPDFISNYSEYYRDKIANSGLSTEGITRQLTEFDAKVAMYVDSNVQSLVMFATVFVLGALVALISEAIVHRN